MLDHYNEKEFCMNFTNQDILQHLVNYARTYPNVDIKQWTDNGSDYKEIYSDSTNDIDCVCFDGYKEDFTISFYGFQTSVFILNEEFMFIDDRAKENITSSHTYGNVVYEGTLRDKNHKEILSLLFEVFKILNGAKQIDIEEHFVSQTGFQYPKCKYTVKLMKETEESSLIQFENITFLIIS